MFGNVNVDLFYFFNHNFQNPIFDAVMPIVTHFGGFKVLIVVLKKIRKLLKESLCLHCLRFYALMLLPLY